jgi:hypothetical protein
MARTRKNLLLALAAVTVRMVDGPASGANATPNVGSGTHAENKSGFVSIT